jgi:alkylhydroperoxidase/carboxymuconolactone decarboxylase family protein YurZ
MAISDTVRRNHEELFPGHVSTLATTDPELIEVFDNFAFDEVLHYGELDTRTRLMTQLAAIIACQALAEYRAMLGAALTVGVTPVEVKEIVYQAVPHVAWPKSSTSCTPPTTCLSIAASSCLCPANPPLHPTRDTRQGWRCKSGSSETMLSRRCMPMLATTSSTFSITCRPTASAATSPATAWTSRPVNC